MAAAHPSVRLPVPCPACGQELNVRVTVLESAVSGAAEEHVMRIDSRAIDAHVAQHAAEAAQ